jgi:PHD/YefM family antitoxin component YafN of YafNO toxin-antitoxin module
MATQQITIQVDQAMAQVVRAMIAEVEATGKTATELLKQVRASAQPLALHLEDGESLVMLGEKEYHRLMEAADFAEMEEAIEEGLEDFEQGRVYSREEVDAEMRQRFPFLAKKHEAK